MTLKDEQPAWQGGAGLCEGSVGARIRPEREAPISQGRRGGSWVPAVSGQCDTGLRRLWRLSWGRGQAT